MDQSPSVGIVTRTKNRSVLLRRAIESVLCQTYPNWRMVIVNDGGNAAEVEALVAHYAERAHGRIHCVHNPVSLGMQGASKVGLDELDTDLLVIHDDDDSWAPEFLTIAVHELLRIQQQFPRTQGVTTYSHVVRETIRGNIVEIDSVEPFSGWVPPGFLSLDRMLASNFVPPISFLFTRQAYKDAGPVYEIIPYLGDWDFLIRVLSRYDVYMVPQFLAFYHWRHGGEPGGFSNSVTAEIGQHRLYRQYLQNEWLRQDFAKGQFGPGAYANLRAHIETLLEQAKTAAKQAPPVAAAPAPPPAGPPVPTGLTKEMLDYYWDSLSWRLLVPFRALVNKMLGLPPEKRPVVLTPEEAWRVARSMEESFTWNLLAPVRVGAAVFRFLEQFFNRSSSPGKNSG